jgi:hypothetical protein
VWAWTPQKQRRLETPSDNRQSFEAILEHPVEQKHFNAGPCGPIPSRRPQLDIE